MQRLAMLIVATGLVAATSAGAEELGDAARGQNYAEKVCAECHAVGSDDSVSPNFSAPPFKQVANTSGMTARALVVWLQTPHPSMPNLVIPVDDMHDVVAYIMTLKGKN
jgi:mono/diheme cytochrome c family protein